MTMRLTTVLGSSMALVFVLATGCDKQENLDWSGKALESKTVKLEGRDYGLEIPAGMKEDDAWKSERSVMWIASESDYFSLPKVTLSHEGMLAAKTVAEAASDIEQLNSAVKVTAKEDTEQGFRVVAKSEDNKTISVHEWYRGSDFMIHCEAAQASSDGIPKLDETIALFQKVCGSVKMPAGAAAPQISAEMKDFMGSLGTSDAVTAALAKHGVQGLATADMQMYDLQSPAVTGSRTDGASTCYTMDAKAGVTTRTYELCWTNGKIDKVSDMGMR